MCVCVYSTVLLYMYGKRSRVQLYRQSIYCGSTGRKHCMCTSVCLFFPSRLPYYRRPLILLIQYSTLPLHSTLLCSVHQALGCTPCH